MKMSDRLVIHLYEYNSWPGAFLHDGASFKYNSWPRAFLHDGVSFKYNSWPGAFLHGGVSEGDQFSFPAQRHPGMQTEENARQLDSRHNCGDVRHDRGIESADGGRHDSETDAEWYFPYHLSLN